MADNGIGASSAASSTIQHINLECKNLYDYLKSRPPAVLDKLYNHPTVCLAVYRLDHLTIIILLLLYNYYYGNYSFIIMIISSAL